MDKSQMEQIGLRIKNARNQLGLTQEVASEKINLTYSAYTKIENGIVGVSLDSLLKIAEFYNLSLDFLVYGKDDNVKEQFKYRNINALINLMDKDGISNTINALKKIKKIIENSNSQKNC